MSLAIWILFAAAGAMRYFHGPIRYAFSSLTRDQYLGQAIDSPFAGYADYGFIEWANRKLPQDAVLLDNTSKSFHLHARWVGMTRIRTIANREKCSATESAGRIGITHASFSPGFMASPEYNAWKDALTEIGPSPDGRAVLFEFREQVKDN